MAACCGSFVPVLSCCCFIVVFSWFCLAQRLPRLERESGLLYVSWVRGLCDAVRDLFVFPLSFVDYRCYVIVALSGYRHYYLGIFSIAIMLMNYEHYNETHYYRQQSSSFFVELLNYYF